MSYHLFSMVRRKARKQHRCIWCGEAVLAGEEYLEERSVYEGQFQHNHWHPECQDDAQEGLRQGDDAEYIPYSQDRPRQEPCHA